MASAAYLGNCLVVQTEDAKAKAATSFAPMHASVQDLKNGKWCSSKNHGQPGTISNVKMSKTGKHGHAKFTFNLSYPFTGQTSQEMFPGHTHLHRPNCTKYETSVSYVDEEGNVDSLTEKDEDCALFMDFNYVDKNGVTVGANFKNDYDEKFEGNGDQMILSVLEGPIHCDPAIMVRQIVGWKCIADED